MVRIMQRTLITMEMYLPGAMETRDSLAMEIRTQFLFQRKCSLVQRLVKLLVEVDTQLSSLKRTNSGCVAKAVMASSEEGTSLRV